MMSFDLVQGEQSNTLINAAAHPSDHPDPGVFDNFFSGAGNYTMRGLAETGRALSMAGAVAPIAVDAIKGGTELQDKYFAFHDDVFNNAVEYWTPKPGEVGAAGQIAGQLASGVLQAVVSPALFVGTAAMSPAEDLVREGVDANTAVKAGMAQGVSAGIGMKIPYLGNGLATRVLSGVGGNVAQGTIGAAVSENVLKENGFDKQAERFDPWDARGRVVDAMLGAVFGVMAHAGAKAPAKGEAKAPQFSPTDEAAVLVANQARHMEDITPQGRPVSDADATIHVDALKQAMDQVLRGEPVAVDGMTKDLHTVPDERQTQYRTEVIDEAQRIVAEEVPDHGIILPKIEPGLPMADVVPAEHDAVSMKARQAVTDNPDLVIPTNRVDADGNPVVIRAAEALAHANAEVAHAKSVAADVFKTAAHCLLGAL